MKRCSSLLTITTGLLLSAAANAQTASPPILSKSFTQSAIPLNSSTTLSFTIDNPSAANAGGGPGQPTLTGIGFTDNLPAGLVVSTPNGLTGNCPGTITATAGTGTVSLSGASPAAAILARSR